MGENNPSFHVLYYNYTHVDVWPVNRERAFVLPDDHRHLSVHCVFLTTRLMFKKKLLPLPGGQS